MQPVPNDGGAQARHTDGKLPSHGSAGRRPRDRPSSADGPPAMPLGSSRSRVTQTVWHSARMAAPSPWARWAARWCFGMSPRCEVATLSGHRGGILTINYSPSGYRMVSCSADSTVLVWDMSHWTGPAHAIKKPLRLVKPTGFGPPWPAMNTPPAMPLQCVWARCGDDAVAFISEQLRAIKAAVPPRRSPPGSSARP